MRRAIGTVAIGTVLAFGSIPQVHAQTGELVSPVVLPSLEGLAYTQGVTDTGIIVGYSRLDGVDHAVYWVPKLDGGEPGYELYILGPFDEPLDVSGNGYVAGKTGSEAMLWRILGPELVTAISLHLDPSWTRSEALAVNDLGQAAGYIVADVGGQYVNLPVVWQPLGDGQYGVEYLPTDIGQYDILGMNNAGWVVGESPTGAIVGRPSPSGYLVEVLPSPQVPAHYRNSAYDVNEAGLIVGVSHNPSEVLTVWALDKTGMWVASSLGASTSDPSDINNVGQIAGSHGTPDDSIGAAVLAPGHEGYGRIASLQPEYALVRAMNDSGLVVGLDMGANPMTALAWSIGTLTGFDPPIEMDGEVNGVKAGSTIPLRWTVSNSAGVPVTGLTSVRLTLTPMPCEPVGTTHQVEEYAPSPSELLNLGDGRYQLNWRTSRGLAGTCGLLMLQAPGLGPSYLTALFSFR